MDCLEDQQNAMKVMVVGDSISHGREGDWTWRYRIWEWFRQQDIQVSFVGPYKGTVPPDKYEPPRPPPLASEPERPWPPLRTDGGYAAGVAPEFLANSNHFAAGGRQAHQAKGLIAEQIAAYQPDFCFVQLGFNDLGWRVTGPSDTLASIKYLVDQARSVKPDLKFAIANIPHRTDMPGREDLPINTDIYNAMLARWIPGWSSPESPIALVRFCENYSCGGTTSEAAYDGLHPNALGEYQLAQAFSRTLISAFSLGHSELEIPDDIPPRPLPTPANFKAVSAPIGIAVTWDAVYGAFGYDLRSRRAGRSSWDFCHVACNRYDSRHFAKQTWEYQVRTSGGDYLKSPWSSVVSAVAHPEMAPGPSNITTHATPTGFAIAWDPPHGPFSGEVDRYGVITFDRDEPGNLPCVTGVKGERTEIEGLVPGHHYAIAVETWTSIGGGRPANARDVVVGGATPPVPRRLRAVAVDDNSVEVRCLGHPTAAGYLVWCQLKHSRRSHALNREMSVGTQRCQRADLGAAPDPEISFTFSSLVQPPWDYKFAVAAYNGDDMSPWSEWVSAAQLKPEHPFFEKGDSVRIDLRYA